VCLDGMRKIEINEWKYDATSRDASHASISKLFPYQLKIACAVLCSSTKLPSRASFHHAGQPIRQ